MKKLTSREKTVKLHRNSMHIVGMIPARGGSKRIPGKNIKEFHGLPLIAWSVIPALKSNLAKVIVTTDDEAIAQIAKHHGADVPFLRPNELATDTTAIEPVLRHAIEQLEAAGDTIDAIALMMPTFPMRTPELINEAIDQFIASGKDSLISVIPAIANRNPHWILKQKEDGGVVLFNGDPLTKMPTRSQDLPPTYSRNDMIYILKKENLYQETPNLYGNSQELMIMDPFYEADINTKEDWFVTSEKMLFLKMEEESKKANLE